MNVAATALIALGVQVALAIYTAGKLTNEVSNHQDWLTTLNLSVKEHGERIVRVETKLGIE